MRASCLSSYGALALDWPSIQDILGRMNQLLMAARAELERATYWQWQGQLIQRVQSYGGQDQWQSYSQSRLTRAEGRGRPGSCPSSQRKPGPGMCSSAHGRGFTGKKAWKASGRCSLPFQPSCSQPLQHTASTWWGTQALPPILGQQWHQLQVSVQLSEEPEVAWPPAAVSDTRRTGALWQATSPTLVSSQASV